MGRLSGKHVVITGAAGGQGRVACSMFVAEEARVLATDLDESVAAEIEQLGAGSIKYVAADVATDAGIARIAESAVGFLNRIDVLYNNHGLILGKPFLETTSEEWDRVHTTDLKSVYFLAQKIVPSMPRGGSIINVSSIGGLVALENMSAYGAAKGGIVTMTKCLALDLSGRGIRVNAICPGVIDTPMPRNFVENLPDKDAIMNALSERHMMKRLGQPHEVVTLALYLASDESTFMTGSALVVDGGWTSF